MKNKRKRLIFIAAIIFINVCMFILGRYTYIHKYKKYEKLFTVRERLYKYYDGKIDENALVDGALHGMTAALNDPYTRYMNENEFKKYTQSMQGNYTGIGVTMRKVGDKLYIEKVYQDSPAEKAGLLIDDRIISIDGKKISEMIIDEAGNLMKGPKGSEVAITIYREGIGVLDKKIVRDNISINVTGEMLNSSIGFIKVSMFDESAAYNFKKKLDELQKKGMKGIIIDLRDNGGGRVDQCVDMLSNFITKDKVIVSDINKNKKEIKYTSKGGLFIGIPLVVLINGNSASASEIFCGAVRDYKIGMLVGEKTFGKGIVQTVLYDKASGFGDGTGLRVTSSKYYTPSGENIHGKGINPDVVVKYSGNLADKTYLKEKDPQFLKALEIVNRKVGV